MIVPFIEHINFYEWLKFKFLNGELIPDEYLPIQYIQCTGSQYIDTGLKYDKTYYYTVDCEIDNENGNQIFGMYYGYDHGVDVWSGVYQVATDNYNIINTDIPAGQRVNIIIDQSTKTMSVNSFSHTFTGDFLPISSVYPVLLGAYWSSWNNSLRGYGKGKIYSFNYYENDILLRDMIPVIRLSDYKPGMYDKVTQTFFTNQGTGEFETPVYGYLSGNPPFTFNSNGNPLVDYTISGNTVQNGAPSPTTPIMPQGTGDKTANLCDIGNFANSTTDTRSFLQLAITCYHDNEFIERATFSGGARLLDIKTTGNKQILFAVNVANCNRLSIKHNGATKDIVIGNVYGAFSGNYVISFDCDGVNPTIIDGILLENIMLNAGSTALPYEPYGYKIPISSAGQTTPVYLGEVETTRKIKKLVLTGQENWLAASGTEERTVSYISITDAGDSLCLCSHIKYKSSYSASDRNQILLRNLDNRLYIGIDVDIAADLSTFKTWLQQQYAAGTPVCVWYVLANEETGIVNEPLMKIGDYADTLSKAQAGVDIPTTNGSNTLTFDTTLQPSNVNIVYKK